MFIQRILVPSRIFNLVTPLKHMSTASPEVILETINGKGVITLNRPKSLNAYSYGMLQEMTEQIKKWEGEASMIIIKGAGEKAFCAGGDIRFLSETGKRNDPIYKTYMQKEYGLHNRIASLKVPYVSFINGVTMGGGAGLALNGRYSVATERTLYAMPETAIGIIPDGGVTYHFPRLANNLGYFLGLTGTRLRGKDLYHAKLATHTCDSDRLPQLEKELLQLNSADPAMVQEILDKYTKQGKVGGEKLSFADKMNSISEVFGAATVEEILDRLKHDNTKWGKDTLELLMKMCPLSLKATLKQLREGSKLNITEGLVMEYRLCIRLCQSYNFFEGVRATLIDKDKNPKWKPSRVEDVTDEMVDAFFKPLPPGEELTFE